MAPDAKRKDPREWKSLDPPLADWVLEAVSSMGFERMTPVQAATIPLSLGNKDVVVEAVTGSGKTLSYLLPLIQRIVRQEEPTKPRHVAAIIMAPTRELAQQIQQVMLALLKFHSASAEVLPYLNEEEKRPLTSAPVVVPQLLVGGTTTPAQDLAFFLHAFPNVLISTPGRLVELLASPHVILSQATFDMFVMDEADRLLDMGFKADLQKILSRLPKQRRSSLFSASVSDAVGEIIRVGLRNPVKIAVKVKNLKTGGIIQDLRTPASLQMGYVVTPASHKLPALTQILDRLEPRPQKSVVFVSTCAAVDYFQHILPLLLPDAFHLIPLHGKHPPNVRQRNFSSFLTSPRPAVLLTTDLAARGLDIPQVDLVVQVDPPSHESMFMHRCGRAGRAGRRGLSVVFLQPGREEDYVPFLDIRKTPITPLAHPRVEVSEGEAQASSQVIRASVLEDRALHDKAQKAFVSWVRSYSKHTAGSIFRVVDLDWTDLGNAWGLLRLPKMPELKDFKGDRFLGVPRDFDWYSYAYKDKTREKQRQAALITHEETKDERLSKAEAEKAKRKRNTEAWSDKHGREDLRGVRREKKKRKKDAERWATMTEDEKSKERELEKLLTEVRRRNAAQAQTKVASAGGNEEFEGFDD